MTKYILVAGGVISGVGKGVTTASIGKILKEYGYKVTAIKIDPYISIPLNTNSLGGAFITTPIPRRNIVTAIFSSSIQFKILFIL